TFGLGDGVLGFVLILSISFKTSLQRLATFNPSGHKSRLYFDVSKSDMILSKNFFDMEKSFRIPPTIEKNKDIINYYV
ncbi:hypothetical protein GLOIN_2v1515107, partial [Rhizophagus irregularis DAOM 181602=DAOM 197198]